MGLFWRCCVAFGFCFALRGQPSTLRLCAYRGNGHANKVASGKGEDGKRQQGGAIRIVRDPESVQDE